MSRWTEKGKYSEPYESKNATECINKLGKLEDLLEKYEISDSANFDYLEKCIQDHDKYEELQEQVGCPLKIRCKVVCDSYIYNENGIKYKVVYVYEDHFDCEDPFDNDMGYTKMCAFDWSDYKNDWWLKEDKSE